MCSWILGGNMEILYSYIKDNNFIYPITYKDGYIYSREYENINKKIHSFFNGFVFASNSTSL